MSKTREALEAALATLEDVFGKHKIDVGVINQLRDVLAEPEQEPDYKALYEQVTEQYNELAKFMANKPVKPEQEPYAYEHGKSNGDGTYSVVIERSLWNPVKDWPVKPLYTSPQPREWQELDKDEQSHLADLAYEWFDDWLNIYQHISAALRAKNGG